MMIAGCGRSRSRSPPCGPAAGDHGGSAADQYGRRARNDRGAARGHVARPCCGHAADQHRRGSGRNDRRRRVHGGRRERADVRRADRGRRDPADEHGRHTRRPDNAGMAGRVADPGGGPRPARGGLGTTEHRTVQPGDERRDEPGLVLVEQPYRAEVGRQRVQQPAGVVRREPLATLDAQSAAEDRPGDGDLGDPASERGGPARDVGGTPRRCLRPAPTPAARRS